MTIPPPIYKVKRSATAGGEPTSLTFGEMAINTFDKVLFVGGPTGSVVRIVGGGPDLSLSGPTANDLLVYQPETNKWINIKLGTMFSVTGSTLDLTTVSGGDFDPPS
jgi:hypothetical protein